LVPMQGKTGATQASGKKPRGLSKDSRTVLEVISRGERSVDENPDRTERGGNTRPQSSRPQGGEIKPARRSQGMTEEELCFHRKEVVQENTGQRWEDEVFQTGGRRKRENAYTKAQKEKKEEVVEETMEAHAGVSWMKFVPLDKRDGGGEENEERVASVEKKLVDHFLERAYRARRLTGGEIGEMDTAKKKGRN